MPGRLRGGTQYGPVLITNACLLFLVPAARAGGLVGCTKVTHQDVRVCACSELSHVPAVTGHLQSPKQTTQREVPSLEGRARSQDVNRLGLESVWLRAQPGTVRVIPAAPGLGQGDLGEQGREAQPRGTAQELRTEKRPAGLAAESRGWSLRRCLHGPRQRRQWV